MFSVLTGLNGIGKSSVLRFINDKIMSFYENSEKQDQLSIQELKKQIFTRDDIFSTSLKNANNIFVPLTIYNEAQVSKSSSELELKNKSIWMKYLENINYIKDNESGGISKVLPYW
jgi:predicted ATP-binding protein involved in virulence